MPGIHIPGIPGASAAASAVGRVSGSAKPKKKVKNAGVPRDATTASDVAKAGRERFMQGNSPAAIRAQQAYLASLGYDVSQDGIRGKFTNSAWDSYMKGQNPQGWNSFIAKHFNTKPAPAKVGSGGGGAAPVAPVSPGAAGSPAPPPAPVRTTQGAPAPKGIQWGAAIDPTQYAKSAVETEYGPQIAELVRAQSRIQAEGAGAQKDIKGWYDDLIAQANQGAQANTAALSGLLAGHDAAGQGAINALGGGVAAADAAAWSQIGRGEVAAQGLAQGGHDNRLKSLLPQQGVDSRIGVLRDFGAREDDVAGKLGALRAAKGSAYTKALYEGADLQERQKMARINAESQQAMLPLEIQKAQLGIQAGQQGIAAGEQDIARGKIDYDIKLIERDMKLDELRGGGNPTPAFNKLNPEQLSSLRTNLLSEVVSADNPSKLAVNPMRVYNAWGNTIRSVSGSQWNPAKAQNVRQWRDGLLQTFLPGWNKEHPKQKYAFRNGKLVYIGGK